MKKILIAIFIFMPISFFGQLKWKSINDIPKSWVMLERDSIGYLIYNPCNGSTPRISIDNDQIIIYWKLDAPETLTINKYTLKKGNKSFHIYASNKYGNNEFTVEIKDAKHKLVLWTFGEDKWVMTPLEYAKDFRKIDNPCPNEMKPENQFLPVEF